MYLETFHIWKENSCNFSESDCNSQGGVFELTQAFISSSNDDKIEIESLKMKVATLESELKEEKGSVFRMSIIYIYI